MEEELFWKLFCSCPLQLINLSLHFFINLFCHSFTSRRAVFDLSFKVWICCIQLYPFESTTTGQAERRDSEMSHPTGLWRIFLLPSLTTRSPSAPSPSSLFLFPSSSRALSPFIPFLEKPRRALSLVLTYSSLSCRRQPCTTERHGMPRC